MSAEGPEERVPEAAETADPVPVTEPGPEPEWSDEVAAIVARAEETAEQVRLEAEQRADARIAEADRAANNRVEAAEAEAQEILATAAAEAQQLQDAAAQESQRANELAAAQVHHLEAAAQEEAARMSADADAYSTEVRQAAAIEVGELTREARTVAREVLEKGDELSANLHALGKSLRTNADRLLRDVQAAAAALNERLDKVDRRAGVQRPRPARDELRSGDLDVPEFVPRIGRGG